MACRLFKSGNKKPHLLGETWKAECKRKIPELFNTKMVHPFFGWVAQPGE